MPAPDVPVFTATSAPVTVASAPRHVAKGVEAFLAQVGGTAVWNATRTQATVTEANPQATVTLEFNLRSAGSGKTELTVGVTCESAMLAGVPRQIIEQQFEQSCNQIAAVVAHLTTQLGARPPEADGLTGAA